RRPRRAGARRARRDREEREDRAHRRREDLRLAHRGGRPHPDRRARTRSELSSTRNPTIQAGSIMKPKEVVEFAKANDVKFIDLKFIDFPGTWQHTQLPVARLEESMFEDGIAFDGSSIRGWQPINASDMTMIPDAETAKLDPFFAH